MAGNLKKGKDWTRNLSKRRWWHRHFFGREVVCLFRFWLCRLVWFSGCLYKYRHNEDSLVERFVRGLMSFSLLHQTTKTEDRRTRGGSVTTTASHSLDVLLHLSTTPAPDRREKWYSLEKVNHSMWHGHLCASTPSSTSIRLMLLLFQTRPSSVCLPRVRDPH
jgi:hypothetical protein